MTEPWTSIGPAVFALQVATSMQDLAAQILVSPTQGSSWASPVASSASAPSSRSSPGAALADCIAAEEALPKPRRKAAASSARRGARGQSLEDDWTRVKDPKEKKRIQNRVAQRTYRSRMKAKLGELQAKLDSHERLQRQSSRPGSGRGAAESLPSPMAAADKPALGAFMPEQAVYEQAAEPGAPYCGQDFGCLDSPPNSQGSPQPPRSMIWPPSPPTTTTTRTTRADTDGPVTVSQNFVLDCLRFQTQLLNRLSSLQSPHDPLTAPQPCVVDDLLALGPSAADSQSQPGPCPDVFPPARAAAVDYVLDHVADDWKDELLDPEMRHQSQPPDYLGYHGVPAPPMPLTSTDGANADLPPPARGVSPAATSLDERLARLMPHVRAAGFGCFEDLVAAYYGPETPPPAHGQDRERGRCLPDVLSRLFKDSEDWRASKRQPFYDEIMKSAESLITAETLDAQEALFLRVTPLFEAHDGIVPSHVSAALLDVKKSIQQELPKSWAFATALTTENKSPWQHDSSNTALAAILVMQFAGRMPHDQLLQLIGMCL